MISMVLGGTGRGIATVGARIAGRQAPIANAGVPAPEAETETQNPRKGSVVAAGKENQNVTAAGIAIGIVRGEFLI